MSDIINPSTAQHGQSDQSAANTPILKQSAGMPEDPYRILVDKPRQSWFGSFWRSIKPWLIVAILAQIFAAKEYKPSYIAGDAVAVMHEPMKHLELQMSAEEYKLKEAYEEALNAILLDREISIAAAKNLAEKLAELRASKVDMMGYCQFVPGMICEEIIDRRFQHSIEDAEQLIEQLRRG